MSRISSISWCAETLVCSQCIAALSISPTWGILADFFTFIDISTDPSDLESVPLGADAKAVTRSGENAFLVLGARVCGRAVSTDHDAVLSLPNEGVLAAAHSLLVAVLDADGVSRALTVLLAIDLLRVAGCVRVTNVAARALAQVAALQVHAEGTRATRRAGLELRTLVDIPASSNRCVVCKASPAHTLATSVNRYAFLVWRARTCR